MVGSTDDEWVADEFLVDVAALLNSAAALVTAADREAAVTEVVERAAKLRQDWNI